MYCDFKFLIAVVLAFLLIENTILAYSTFIDPLQFCLKFVYSLWHKNTKMSLQVIIRHLFKLLLETILDFDIYNII